MPRGSYVEGGGVVFAGVYNIMLFMMDLALHWDTQKRAVFVDL